MLQRYRLFPNQSPTLSFQISSHVSGVIESVKSANHIDIEACKSIMVKSFIHEYRDIQKLKPEELGKDLISWEDVASYYEKDFNKIFEEFRNKTVDYWIQAKINNKVVGWAVFAREKHDNKAVYMDLLAVDPEEQRQGIGNQLLKSLINLQEIPDLTAINLLLRITNKGGDEFYRKQGFAPNLEYRRENWVDVNLLQGRTWINPAVQYQDLLECKVMKMACVL